MGVLYMGCANSFNTVKLIQSHPKKVGRVGLLSVYGFQNEKIGFRAKSNPNPKNPLIHWIGNAVIFFNNFHINIKDIPPLKKKNHKFNTQIFKINCMHAYSKRKTHYSSVYHSFNAFSDHLLQVSTLRLHFCHLKRVMLKNIII
jgi:hypothetical protein